MDRHARSVFEALAGFDRPASAYDIAEAVSKARGKRVAANSVYRILDLFVGTNLARRVESANAYVANQHPGCLHDCIFLICDNCGQATHIDDDKLSGGVREAAKAPVSPKSGRSSKSAADAAIAAPEHFVRIAEIGELVKRPPKG